MENTPQYVLECHVRYPVWTLSSVMCTPVWRCHQCGMYVLIVKYGFHWNVIRMGTQDTGVTFQLVENHIGIAGVTDDYAASHVTRFWLTTSHILFVFLSLQSHCTGCLRNMSQRWNVSRRCYVFIVTVDWIYHVISLTELSIYTIFLTTCACTDCKHVSCTLAVFSKYATLTVINI